MTEHLEEKRMMPEGGWVETVTTKEKHDSVLRSNCHYSPYYGVFNLEYGAEEHERYRGEAMCHRHRTLKKARKMAARWAFKTEIRLSTDGGSRYTWLIDPKLNC